jgi:hypothetical protein
MMVFLVCTVRVTRRRTLEKRDYVAFYGVLHSCFSSSSECCVLCLVWIRSFFSKMLLKTCFVNHCKYLCISQTYWYLIKETCFNRLHLKYVQC